MLDDLEDLPDISPNAGLADLFPEDVIRQRSKPTNTQEKYPKESNGKASRNQIVPPVKLKQLKDSSAHSSLEKGNENLSEQCTPTPETKGISFTEEDELIEDVGTEELERDTLKNRLSMQSQGRARALYTMRTIREAEDSVEEEDSIDKKLREEEKLNALDSIFGKEPSLDLPDENLASARFSISHHPEM